MKKSTVLFAVLAALLLPASCSLFVSNADTGTLTVNFGPAAQSRGEAAPEPPAGTLASAPDFFPRFGEVTLTISGPGMDPVTTTVDSASGVASLAVPAGNDRTVELYAVPDWDTTAAAFPTLAALMPTLVKAYGATAEVDISAGRSTEVALRLSVAETKILLPDPSSGRIGYADTISSPSSLFDISGLFLSDTSDLAYDRYGYLYISYTGTESPGGVSRLVTTLNNSLENLPVVLVPYLNVYGIAMDTKNNRLYLTTPQNPYSLSFVDLSSGTPPLTPINVLLSLGIAAPVVSVDEDGYVYAITGSADPLVSKIRVDFDGSAYSGTVVDSATISSLGITSANSTITDMQAYKEHLFIAVADTNPTNDENRGKVVQVNRADLSLVNAYGWSDVAPTDPESTSLFGPTRFLAIAPRKLYLSDEDDSSINRVVEVDLESGAISAVMNVSGISFFQAY